MENLFENLESLSKNVQSSMDNFYKSMGTEHHEAFVRAAKSANLSEVLKKIEDAKKEIKNAKFE